MTIVLVGGGSGGHITPLLAVAQELKALHPQAQLVYIGQRKDKLGDIPSHDPNIHAAYNVRAGKFRRYHGQGFIRQLCDVPTMAKNIRDAWWTFVGLLQSHHLLKRLQPDIIFIKGGFVGVPVGLAAAWLHIPYITHDSDAVPGLANRIIARWAMVHAVGLSKETYDYPLPKTFSVGVPVQANFCQVDATLQAKYRHELELDDSKKVIFVTGGGQGAQRLNNMIIACTPQLLKRYGDLVIVLVAGRQHEQLVRRQYESQLSSSDQERVIVKGYIEDLYRYSGAADVIIARAGATNIAEFAIQAKACILVPNPDLTRGHQLKNADLLRQTQAVEVVADEDTEALEATTVKLLDSESLRTILGQNLHKLAHPTAAKELAELLLQQLKQGSSNQRQNV